jgi:hypothetical protein
MSFDLFQEWREADRAASAAERAVLADSLRSIEAMGNSPAVYHLEKARRRRSIANDLLEIAMAATGAQEDAIQRKNSGDI